MVVGELRTDREGHTFDLRPIQCPTCGPSTLHTIGMRGGTHQRWGLGVETPIVECEGCGLLFPNPFPYPVEPQKLYGDPDKYFAAHDLDHKVQRYRQLAKELKARCRVPQPRLLDIGAGRGDFLYAARLEGFLDPIGLEFADAMIDFAREHFQVRLEKKSAEELAASEGRAFDAIVLNAVLEHVYDPNAFMEAVARLTKSGGVVYLDLPREPHLLTMVGNAVNRALGKPAVYNLQPTWPPFHVYGFNPRALGRLLDKHGFDLEAIRVHASTKIRASEGLKDRAKALAGQQINRLANLTGLASNMYVWARRR